MTCEVVSYKRLFHSMPPSPFMVQAPCSAFCEFCKNNKAVIWVLDPGWGTGLGYVRPSVCVGLAVWWWCVCVWVCACVGRLSQLIPWESVVSLDHLRSSQGRGVAPGSHQADDRTLRALHAALISAMIASLHRPYLCFIYSLSDNNKCLLSAIVNYIFISLPTSLKQTSIVCRDFLFIVCDIYYQDA